MTSIATCSRLDFTLQGRKRPRPAGQFQDYSFQYWMYILKIPRQMYLPGR